MTWDAMLVDEHAHGMHTDGCACSSADSPRCDETFLIDYDSLDCQLAADHDGPHECRGEGGLVAWGRYPINLSTLSQTHESTEQGQER